MPDESSPDPFICPIGVMYVFFWITVVVSRNASVYIVLDDWMDWHVRLKYHVLRSNVRCLCFKSCPCLTALFYFAFLWLWGSGVVLDYCYVNFTCVFHMLVLGGRSVFLSMEFIFRAYFPPLIAKLYLQFWCISFPNLAVLHSTQPSSWQNTSPKMLCQFLVKV